VKRPLEKDDESSKKKILTPEDAAHTLMEISKKVQ